MVTQKRPLLSPAHLCSFRLYSERCLSGLKSTLGKRVCALKRTEGSNPSLSAMIKRMAEEVRALRVRRAARHPHWDEGAACTIPLSPPVSVGI